MLWLWRSSACTTQIGDPRDYLPLDVNTRTGSWGRPSDMPPNRNATILTPNSKGGADAVAAAAAALAATYQVRWFLQQDRGRVQNSALNCQHCGETPACRRLLY
jgi:hypothetical protein